MSKWIGGIRVGGVGTLTWAVGGTVGGLGVRMAGGGSGGNTGTGRMTWLVEPCAIFLLALMHYLILLFMYLHIAVLTIVTQLLAIRLFIIDTQTFLNAFGFI
jgi:hypothetical protein